MNLNPRRLALLILFDLQHALSRVKGLFFLLPFIVIWSALLSIFDQNNYEYLKQLGLSILAHKLDYETAVKLFVENSALLSWFFIINIYAMPLYVVIAGFDQFSSDLGSGYFRMLNNRTSRLEIFIARYLSALTVLFIGFFGMGLLIAVLSSSYDEQAFSEVLAYLFLIEGKMLLYAASILAFVAIISSFSKWPLVSLFLSGFLYFILFMLTAFRRQFYHDSGFITYLIPDLYKEKIIHIDWSIAGEALLAVALYIVIYGLFAWLIFRRRSW